MSIFDDFQSGTGAFSPLAMSHERKFARAAAPGLAAALGHMGAANVGAAGQVASSRINAGAHLKAAGIQDAGQTLRTSLLMDANKILEEMRQGGQNYRTKYAADRGFDTHQYVTDANTEMDRRRRLLIGDRDSSMLDATSDAGVDYGKLVQQYYTGRDRKQPAAGLTQSARESIAPLPIPSVPGGGEEDAMEPVWY